MSWVAPLVFAFILTGVVLGGLTTRRSHVKPLVYWFAAWGFQILSMTVWSLPIGREAAALAAGCLSPIFPVLLLAGAYRYADREAPRVLIPLGLVLCGLHGSWSAAGLTTRAGVLELGIEPALCVAAASIALPFARARGTILQRLVVPSLLIIAAVEAIQAVGLLLEWGDWNRQLIWLAVGFPLAAIHFAIMFELVVDQLTATARERDRHAEALALTIEELRHSKREVEQRVRERTEQLRAEVLERRRAEEALRRSENHYRKVSRLMTDYNYAARIDPDGKVHTEWLVGALTRITGYSAVEALELDWLGLTHPDDLPAVTRCVESALCGGIEEFRCRIHTKSGEVRWILARVMGERNEETGEVLLHTAGHDITEKVEAEIENQDLREQVREAHRLESLGALAGGVAHDFNNLLSVILGNAAILSDHLSEDSPLHARAERIRSSARYASEITTQMLTYAGGASLQTEPLDLSRLVAEMRQLIDSGTTKPVRIVSRFVEGLPRIEGDASQIRQVLLNLITNASEALGEQGGVITLRTGVASSDPDAMSADLRRPASLEDGDYVVLEVADDGPGIEEQTRSRIFEPFFSTKVSGRGLGLAVVHGIVRSHGGAITVDSRVGEGTVFRVFLPVLGGSEGDTPMTTPATEVAEAVESERVAPRTILVIDDDEAVNELTQIFLEAAGFEVLVADGGHVGLEIHQKNRDRIGAVVLDLSMPDMPGEQVLDRLRDRDPGLPIVVSSGYTNTIAADRIGHPEHTAFVQKPCEPEALVAHIRSLSRER